MSGAIRALAQKIAELERKIAAAHRQGVVSVVDPAQGLVRLDLGDGMLSPWVPYVQAAGALKVHSPPSPGQIMTIMSPSGETAQGFAVALSFGAGNESPSTAGDEHVLTFGAVRIELTAEGVMISAGGVTLTVSAAGVAVTGGHVTHDGTNIGASHRHGGVDRGSSNTDAPN